MLKKIRISLAAFCLVAMSLLFADISGLAQSLFHWLPDIQVLPALLALNLVVVAALFLLTLVFGRLYCSILCPLGVFQDLLMRISHLKKRQKYCYRPGHSFIRFTVFAVFLIALVSGISSIVILLDPYSAFGRMAATLFAPLYRMANNGLAWIAQHLDSYAFYAVPSVSSGMGTWVTVLLTLLVLCLFAIKFGREYCNTLCPVGTALGLLSRFSLLKIRINEQRCHNCGLCESSCKASCIDSSNHSIDYTRCVACMNCLDSCAYDALSYSLPGRGNKVDASASTGTMGQSGAARRELLAVMGIFTASFPARIWAKNFDGGLAVIKPKKQPSRDIPLVPPGAEGLAHFQKHCTGCHLCVSSCPNQVLVPGKNAKAFQQPYMTFEKGYCRPECTECSQVCPTGAILPISVKEKAGIHIGHAVWQQQDCIVIKDKVQCDNCARHCTSGAIKMIAQNPEDPQSLKIPMVDVNRCLGCGACENLCPSRPYSAIYVHGHERHQTA